MMGMRVGNTMGMRFANWCHKGLLNGDNTAGKAIGKSSRLASRLVKSMRLDLSVMRWVSGLPFMSCSLRIRPGSVKGTTASFTSFTATTCTADMHHLMSECAFQASLQNICMNSNFYCYVPCANMQGSGLNCQHLPQSAEKGHSIHRQTDRQANKYAQSETHRQTQYLNPRGARYECI